MSVALQATQYPAVPSALRGGFEVPETEGRVSLVRLAPAAVLIGFEGVLSKAPARALTRALLSERARSGPLTLFFDATELEHYGPEFRRGWARWSKQREKHLRRIHVLVTPRVREMGLHLFPAELGALIQPHGGEETFEAAMMESRAQRLRD